MHFVDHIAMIMQGQRQKNIIRYELKRKQTVYYPNNQVLQKYSFSVARIESFEIGAACYDIISEPIGLYDADFVCIESLVCAQRIFAQKQILSL